MATRPEVLQTCEKKHFRPNTTRENSQTYQSFKQLLNEAKCGMKKYTN